MEKTRKVIFALMFATALPLFACAAAQAAPPSTEKMVGDTFLEIAFAPPAGWKWVAPEDFKFGLVEADPAYIFQKGNAVIFILFDQAQGVSLRQAAEWLADSASSVGKTYGLNYRDVNGRTVGQFMVSGKGANMGSIPSLASKQIDNTVVVAINGRWLLRIIYSSPSYKTEQAAFENFLSTLTFQGAAGPDEPAYTNDDRPLSAPPAGDNGNCTSAASLNIQAPADGSRTGNTETSLKIAFNDIDEVRVRINGKEVAIFSGTENPIFRKVILVNGENRIEAIGRDVCGREVKDSATIIREEPKK